MEFTVIDIGTIQISSVYGKLKICCKHQYYYDCFNAQLYENFLDNIKKNTYAVYQFQEESNYGFFYDPSANLLKIKLPYIDVQSDCFELIIDTEQVMGGKKRIHEQFDRLFLEEDEWPILDSIDAGTGEA